MAGPAALPNGFSARRLTHHDVEAAHALSDAIGWTQTEADWQFLAEEGVVLGCFREKDGLAATAAFSTFGRIARVGMVLVDERFRHQGIARHLVGRIVDDIDAAGLIASLDARPELGSFYEGHGFRPTYEVLRLRADRAATSADLPEPVVRIAGMQAGEIAEIGEYDTQSSGAERAALLRHLHGRRGDLAHVARAGEWCAGYVMGRDGRGATQLGPLIAEDEDTAVALAHAALARARGPLVVDVPAAQRSYVDWLAKLGFGAPQTFVRMVRGGDGPIDQPDYVFALAGLEFG